MLQRYRDTKRFIIVTLIVMLFTYLSTSYTVAHQVRSSRQGCERLDVARVALYTVLIDAQQALDKRPGKRFREAAELYQRKTDELIRSAAPFADKPGSPHVSCVRAYPDPLPTFPFSP